MGAAGLGAIIGAGIGGLAAQEKQSKFREQAGRAAVQTEASPLFAIGGQNSGIGETGEAPTEL